MSYLEKQRQIDYGQDIGATFNQESLKHAREGANRISPKNRKAEKSAQRKAKLAVGADTQDSKPTEVDQASRFIEELPVLPKRTYVASYRRLLKPSPLDSQAEERRLTAFHANTVREFSDPHATPKREEAVVFGSEAYDERIKEIFRNL